MCPLCGTPVAADAIRCDECGLHLAAVAGRPSPFSTRVLWYSAAALLGVYIVTLLIVALAR
jgi:hypothetical protein